MTVRNIRIFGDPVLTSTAAAVEVFDHKLETLIQDMLETMDAAGGVGLAANQIGVLKRVFVFDTTHTEGGLRGHIINPTWKALGEETQVGPEGCLSIPDIQYDVERAQDVEVRGVDVQGNPVSIVASGLLARCIQHESDHLDGVLFLKRLSPALRKEAMREIRAAEWFQQ
ncbi:peptide deformylase [Corynebacterium pelargi]|uniref:Peptide deformylase n=1 Tax=Corynebacterium pelargi TaxID=1471400 RepID=A0A410W8N5_9CORY|nr:peptide deformylase [Corynebacterium pelargi]QAU52310.1 Peptide deformylase [Corynebacterium pelargi]GGG68565.1 peptide deformylase 1 [Corynebacterium pelargi]